ncbi:MAG: hypothetical protein NTX53_20325 [candidate division WOR-3 bacterium]|nr:hypothetical protein [candidate division WOR-3 bacterium]
MKTFREFLSELATRIGLPVPQSFSGLDEIHLAQHFLNRLNEYFYQTHKGIGTTTFQGEELQYFSEFHRFWEAHGLQIINPQVCLDQAPRVAACLAKAIDRYGRNLLSLTHQTHGLDARQIAAVRFLTAAQDFRKPPEDAYAKYLKDPTRFDPGHVADEPADFLKFLGVQEQAQNDKRLSFAKNAAAFLMSRRVDGHGIAGYYKNDAVLIRAALVAEKNMGYGLKKANMFIRDMVELGVWPGLTNLDQVDVASDINTMKLALRTGMVKTDIPILSSFLDIFCHQYEAVDLTSVAAWRAVWSSWRLNNPATAPVSPCFMDFVLYRIGREYCDDKVVEYKCDKGHVFYHFGAALRNCRVCQLSGDRTPAIPGSRFLPCQLDNAKLPRENGVLLLKPTNLLYVFDGNCILEPVCNPKSSSFRALDPPKSISIKGRTGWTESYAYKDRGGGGMMG